MMYISTNITNMYLASIRFGILQYICNTQYKSQHIPTVLGYLTPRVTFHANNKTIAKFKPYYEVGKTNNFAMGQ